MLDVKIAILGNGYMATAIASGLIESSTVDKDNIFFINDKFPETLDETVKNTGAKKGKGADISSADVVICAFKPQNFDEAAQMYGRYIKKESLVISIMAGISIDTIEEKFANKAAVIRVMPNLALSVQMSASAYALGRNANENNRLLFENIFKPLGTVIKTEEEKLSAVTALSGSGPAYFYYLCECMTEAAEKAGLDKETAHLLCRQTLLGTAELWKAETTEPQQMRARITSKKGTTDAAISKMESEGFEDIVKMGIDAAICRSEEIADELKNPEKS